MSNNVEHTTKSFHSTKRDKPRHSMKDHSVAKKGGAGGKGTWGAEKDDVKYIHEDGHAVDTNDPNFDPIDQNEGGYDIRTVFASEKPTRIFHNRMSDLNTFKKSVRSACDEFLVSHDLDEFTNSVLDMDFSLYHQDLPAILIKHSLDMSDDHRERVSFLLHALYKEELITSSQMVTGFRKLYDAIGDLAVDAPNVKVIMAEFVAHGMAAGYLDAQASVQMQQEADEAANAACLVKAKEDLSDAVVEYFSSGEMGELTTAVGAVAPALRYEAVKILLTLAMDRTDADRERASNGFAALVSNGSVTSDQAIKGVTILLNRVEDIFLDVPDVLRLLSFLIARGVVDEALPPSFLLRLDLSESDMGFQVASHARAVLNHQNAAEDLEKIWVKE